MPGTKRTLAFLEEKFQTGDKPTQQDFYDLFASFMHYTQMLDTIGNSSAHGMTQAAITAAINSAIGSALNQKWKDAVKAATTAALPANTQVGLTLVASANGAFPNMDNVAIGLDESVLLKDEAVQSKNGVYTLTQVGDGSNPWILTRRSDADTGAELESASVPVAEGDTHHDTSFRQTSDSIVLGTTAIVWQDMGTTEVKPRLTPIIHSTVVNLDGNWVASKSITGAMAYTKGAESHLVGNIREDHLIADGVNKPTFSSDFAVVWDNWVNTINTLNVIRFEYLSNGKIAVDLRWIE